ncbi:MAG TPA: hypothetical protein VN673_17070, partial [Clostridia bacterium]|nr:hypothetical protein [Clostridia bacterium]
MSIIKTIASILDGRGGTPVGVENVARRPPPSATNPNPAGQPSGLYKGAMSREQLRVDVPVPDTGGELKVTVLPKAEASGLDLSGVPFPTMEQDLAFRAAVLERGFQVPADVITLLDELDEPWLRLQEAFAKFSTSNAKTDYFKALAATAEGIASGDRTAEDADNFTLSEWAEDYAQKRTAMKKSTRDIELQAR